jgi:hypothetical protein
VIDNEAGWQTALLDRLTVKELGRTPWSPESEQEAMKRGRCGGRTRPGGTCINVKGYKTDHLGYGRCKFHTGATENGRKAAEKERVQSEIARLFLEERVKTEDPVTGLSEQQRRAEAMAKALERYVTEQVDEWYVGNRFGELVRHAAVEDLGLWTDKASRIDKLAIDANLDQRRQAFDERQGAIFAELVRTFLIGMRAAMVARGAAEGLIGPLFSEDVPQLMQAVLRGAIEAESRKGAA